MPSEPFDKEAVYDEQIAPLMTRIIEICREHQMPMLCSILYGVTGDGDDQKKLFCSTHQHFGRGLVDEFDRAFDVIRSGLPENRLMAFTITTERREPGEKHRQQAHATYHDWRERAALMPDSQSSYRASCFWKRQSPPPSKQ